MLMHIEIRFKTTMVWSNSCESSDKYILVKWNIEFTGSGADVGVGAGDVKKWCKEGDLKIRHHLLLV